MASPAAYALADADERRRALDPESSFIVQAPAGSGKTELLMQRFLTLLARVERPEALVAITFTKKAAAEMRTRILQALTRASRGEQPEQRHQQATFELAQQALRQDQLMGWNLLAHPSRLRIETMDALNMSIVSQMPWLARMGSAYRPVEKAERLYQEAAMATLQMLSEPGAAGQAIARFLLHRDNQLNEAARLLAEMLGKRDQWLRYIGVNVNMAPEQLQGARVVLEQGLREIVESHLAATHRRLGAQVQRELVPLLRYAGKMMSDAALQEVPFDLQPWADQVEHWRTVAKALMTGREFRKSPNARQGFPAGRPERQRMIDLLDRLRDDGELGELLHGIDRLPPARFDDEQWDLVQALFAVLPLAVAQLQLIFQAKGVVDFIEIGQAALRALGPPEEPTDLGLAMGGRIEHLLVDEFQDTSISQMALLRALTRGWDQEPDRTLFLVGDPMQSIYRFRQAEVGLFLTVQQQGWHELSALPLEALELQVNFRSRPEIVDWNNEAFGHVFPEQEDPPSGSIRFRPSVAALLSDEDAGVTVYPLFGEDHDAEAALVADLIEQAEGTTAILVRSRSHLSSITPTLHQRGIRFRAVEIETLGDRPVVQDLHALTRALVHLGDRTSWLAVLRAPWCGATLAELSGLFEAKPYATIWDTLRESNVSEAMRRTTIVLEEALAGQGRQRFSRWIENTWVALGGPAVVDGATGLRDAARYFQLLDELTLDGATFVEPSFADLEGRLAELFAEPDLEASDRVQVMTIHKAKGLEFDNVILPGLGRSAGGPDMPVLRFDEQASESGTRLLVAARSAKGDERDPLYQYVNRLEKARERNEEARLLYVAATRARRRLHLLGHANLVSDQWKAPGGSLLDRLWPAVSAHYVAQAPPPYGLEREAPSRWARVLRMLPEGWQAPDAPRLPEREMSRPVVEEPALQAMSEAGEVLRLAGTLVHRLLHDAADEGWPSVQERWQSPVVRAGWALWLQGEGLGRKAAAEALQIVETAVRNVGEDERGRWVLARHAGARNEWALAGVDEDGVIRHVVIDRTFVADGVRWVVDYETSRHEGGGIERFLKEDAERYRPSLRRYVRFVEAIEPGQVVKAALYYPLLRVWHEVDVEGRVEPAQLSLGL